MKIKLKKKTKKEEIKSTRLHWIISQNIIHFKNISLRALND